MIFQRLLIVFEIKTSMASVDLRKIIGYETCQKQDKIRKNGISPYFGKNQQFVTYTNFALEIFKMYWCKLDENLKLCLMFFQIFTRFRVNRA